MTALDVEQLVASATAITQLVDAIVDALDVRDQTVADATVAALVGAGWLLQTPSTMNLVKRIIRDEGGVVVAVVDRIEPVDWTSGRPRLQELEA